MVTVKIPTPGELGLPEQFENWRPNQEHGLSVMITSPKRVPTICAPTGWGKSPVVFGYAQYMAQVHKKRTCILTESRGLQDQYMCLAPDTKLCTGDLHWVSNQSVKIGDTLLGFDEFRSPNRRMWRPAVVEGVATLLRPCYRIVLEDGTEFTASMEHPWLIEISRNRPPCWRCTADLNIGDCLMRVLPVWDYVQDYDTGYLAAAFNGEGHLHQSQTFRDGGLVHNGVDVNLSFAQLQNPMFEDVKSALARKGFRYSISTDKKGCNRLQIGGRANTIRFLGQIRPSRILPKLDLAMLGMLNPVSPTKIVALEILSRDQEVIAICTSTKTYVAQGYATHNSEFGSAGLVDIRGRRNYKCDLKPDYTCEEGYAARCPYKGSVACPSSAAEMRAATSWVVCTNYDKWTSAKKFGTGMTGFDVVIFDEAHSAPDALARAMQVTLHHREIEQDLELAFPVKSNSTEFINWKPWFTVARATAESAMALAQARITGVKDAKPAWVRDFTHKRNLLRRLNTLVASASRDWVVEEVPQGFQFDPIRPGKYSESCLLLRTPRVVAVSAVVRPKSMFMIGVGRDSMDFVEFDSDFDPLRCPIYWIDTQRVDSNHPSLDAVWTRLDQIAARRRDRKGIVHTVSFDRQMLALKQSRFASNILINERGEPPTSMIESFNECDPSEGPILASPSIGTGYDFKGDKCEWQFLCKIPWEPRSVVMSAREQEDPEYGAFRASNKMVQIFGRAMREKTDSCENFIPDNNLEWFLPRYGHLTPKSFRGFFKYIKTLPPPLPKL